MQDIQSAKQEGGNNPQVRPPDREDNQGDCQPAAVTERVVAPDAAGIVHDIVQAAESGDHAADTGCRILIPIYADAGCVRRSRILTHCTQVQSDPGPFQHICGDQGKNHCQISQESVGQEQLAEPPGRIRAGQFCLEGQARIGQGQVRHGVSAQLDQAAAEEIAEAHAESSHREAGHVLIGAQRHRQETVQQAHQQGAQQRREQCDQYSQ